MELGAVFKACLLPLLPTVFSLELELEENTPQDLVKAFEFLGLFTSCFPTLSNFIYFQIPTKLFSPLPISGNADLSIFSVACSEASGELKSGTRNRWFILFTNVMIDWGFVIGAFVPYILVIICTENHLRAAWRISLGLGVVPPLLLLWLRVRLQEPEEFKKYVQAIAEIRRKLTPLKGEYEICANSILASDKVLLEETFCCQLNLVPL